MPDLIEVDDIPAEADGYDEVGGEKGWTLKKLKPMHKQVCALLAQGMKQVDIAHICNVTPVYISMLTKQPLCIAYIQDMSAVANVQLEAMFTQSVDTIAETMQNGNSTEKLKAARLQLEATKRIGPRQATPLTDVDALERLTILAERLTRLNTGGTGYTGGGRTLGGEFKEVKEVQQDLFPSTQQGVA